MTLAIGCDLANWQIYFDPSKATGQVDFAIQKVTDGANTHTALESMWLGVKQVVVRGAYHYQRSGVNWQVQADKFLAVAEAKDFHIYALDLEGANNVVSDTFLLDTQRIINYWKNKTNKRVILYTNIEFYKKLQALGLNSWLNTIDLWIANPNHDPGNPPLPPFRTTWTFHQYSWTGLKTRWGTGANTDEDVFNGTFDELKQWAGATTPPTGEPPMTLGTAKENGGRIGNIRTIPSRYGTTVSKSPAGATINFVKIVNSIDVGAFAADEYFELADGRFLNYIISGQKYFTILTIPSVTPPPPPPPSTTSIFITHTFTDSLAVKQTDGTVKNYNASFVVPNVEYKPQP